MRLDALLPMAMALAAAVSALPGAHPSGLAKRAEGAGSKGSVNGYASSQDGIRRQCQACMEQCLNTELMVRPRSRPDLSPFGLLHTPSLSGAGGETS